MLDVTSRSNLQNRLDELLDTSISLEKAGWDREILAIELQNLIEMETEFSITATGFDISEIEGGPDRDWPHSSWPRPIEALERGPLVRITGRAVAANLPAHIAQRMADRARAGLSDLGVPVQIEPLRVRAVCPGAVIFLLADYETLAASFSAHGRQGKPSEVVADECGLRRCANIMPRVPPSN
jgi:RNA 3'-terminal phosphate cyclase (RTC), insert domain